MLIFYQLLPLSPSASRRHFRCWRIVVVVGVSALAPCRQSRRCRRLVIAAVFFVVGSGFISCGWVCRLLCLVVGNVLLLLFAAASSQSKLTYPFFPKFQQFIGTNRKVFKRFWANCFCNRYPTWETGVRLHFPTVWMGDVSASTELDLNRFFPYPF